MSECGIYLSGTESIIFTGCQVYCDICKSKMAGNFLWKGDSGFDEALKTSYYAKLKPWIRNQVNIIAVCDECKESLIVDAKELEEVS